MYDNRIVLPLDHVREAAAMLCTMRCRAWYRVRNRVVPTEHADVCLVPLIEQRDALLGTTYAGKVSPDCQVGGVKCQACTGCLHECHRPLGGQFEGRHGAAHPTPS